jgi:hypothetical protein
MVADNQRGRHQGKQLASKLTLKLMERCHEISS